jgi:hypothetical protein
VCLCMCEGLLWEFVMAICEFDELDCVEGNIRVE